ncbi:hypothetical protein M0802_014579 [Mischocyttarus mexicanus]|nr:hypothetical protein M0802_014579 [Mischocyttarus mexicanus]
MKNEFKEKRKRKRCWKNGNVKKKKGDGSGGGGSGGGVWVREKMGGEGCLGRCPVFSPTTVQLSCHCFGGLPSTLLVFSFWVSAMLGQPDTIAAFLVCAFTSSMRFFQLVMSTPRGKTLSVRYPPAFFVLTKEPLQEARIFGNIGTNAPQITTTYRPENFDACLTDVLAPLQR